MFWINRTVRLRDLPDAFGMDCPATVPTLVSVGCVHIVLQALADSGGDAHTLQMIDSTTVRAHRCAAGERGA